jgi:hypothetical protein
MTMALRLVLFTVLALSSARAQAQDSLERIRQLYVGADYDGVLAELDRLPPASVVGEELERDHYRAMALIAVGRTPEAHAAIERILLADPAYEPGEEEAAPRIRIAFSDVRRRVLPQLARSLYGEGKAAFDRKDVAQALPAFERALTVIDLLPAGEPGMADLRTLATGFLQLSRASSTAAGPVPTGSAGNAETPTAVATGGATSLPATATEAELSGPPASPPDAAVAADAITDPVALLQELPPWNPGKNELRPFSGIIEVDIDEHGDVAAARMISPVHPVYDPVLLAKARQWKYEPARRGGVAVKSTKRISVALHPY